MKYLLVLTPAERVTVREALRTALDVDEWEQPHAKRARELLAELEDAPAVEGTIRHRTLERRGRT